MVSASCTRRKSRNRSACEPRAPRWTSEINKVRKRRSGLSSLISSLPMREHLAKSHDNWMTTDVPDSTVNRAPDANQLCPAKKLAAACDTEATSCRPAHGENEALTEVNKSGGNDAPDHGHGRRRAGRLIRSPR